MQFVTNIDYFYKKVYKFKKTKKRFACPKMLLAKLFSPSEKFLNKQKTVKNIAKSSPALQPESARSYGKCYHKREEAIAQVTPKTAKIKERWRVAVMAVAIARLCAKYCLWHSQLRRWETLSGVL